MTPQLSTLSKAIKTVETSEAETVRYAENIATPMNTVN